MRKIIHTSDPTRQLDRVLTAVEDDIMESPVEIGDDDRERIEKTRKWIEAMTGKPFMRPNQEVMPMQQRFLDDFAAELKARVEEK